MRSTAESLREGAGWIESGTKWISETVLVDQSPIGRTPRSNPVTYIKAFDNIREVFAATREAQAHGFNSGSFSFNIPGGRCETCEGDGTVTVEMQFLADVELICEDCKGMRYKSAVLEILYKGKNIYEVLQMTVREALHFFANVPKITKKLHVLDEVGLGYLRLGQSATTLSGGEAQRIKLAAYLSRDVSEKTLFIFDEPTTGLHFDDINKLLIAFRRLIEAGGTVLIIEHNLDVIKCADWVIDLGPEGGDGGGRIVAVGPPEQIAANPGISYWQVSGKSRFIMPAMKQVITITAGAASFRCNCLRWLKPKLMKIGARDLQRERAKLERESDPVDRAKIGIKISEILLEDVGESVREGDFTEMEEQLAEYAATIQYAHEALVEFRTKCCQEIRWLQRTRNRASKTCQKIRRLRPRAEPPAASPSGENKESCQGSPRRNC